MKKRIWLVLLVAAATLAVVPAVALAALGVHGAIGGAEGACADCHNTAQVAATRGWGRATIVAGTGWYAQPITLLCWSCHGPTAVAGSHDVTGGAMNASNHQYTIGNSPPDVLNYNTRDNVAMIASGLPYVTGAAIQCTSCHNVHNDAFRPYMMKTTTGANMTVLCDTCHPGRNTTALRALNIGVGGDNVSVHPVDVIVTGLTATTAMKAIGLVPASLKNNNVAAPASNAYFLGGKLSTYTAGNIECTTCHIVHGSQTGPGSAFTQSFEDYLAIDQASASSAATSSALCEACHYGGFGTGSVGTGGSDHPVDNVRGRVGFYPTGTALPAEWLLTAPRLDTGAAQFSTVGATATAGTPRCSSCHDTHGGMGTKSLLRRPVPAAAAGEWCWSCHTATQVVPRLHHSNVSTLGTSQINCGHCHSGGTAPQTAAGWAAHNGFGNMDMGPDSQLASPTALTGVNALNTTAANASTWQFMCERCHNSQNPTIATTLAGLPAPLVAGATFTGLPSRHGVSTGQQTHLTSRFSLNPAQVIIRDLDRTWNSYIRTNTNTWGNVSALAYPAAPAIQSKYNLVGGAGTVINPTTVSGGAGAAIICESCHNLLYNAGVPATTADVTAGYMANLLVMNYQDDGQGAAFAVSPGHTSGTAVGDGLCRGCHSSNVPPAAIAAGELSVPTVGTNTYVHYPAAHTERSAYYTYNPTPYGRSTNTLLTAYPGAGCPNNSTADNTTAPNVFSYPAVNVLNCDSCHRPHNANTTSVGTTATMDATAAWEPFILEPGPTYGVNQAKTQPCTQCHDSQAMCNY